MHSYRHQRNEAGSGLEFQVGLEQGTQEQLRSFTRTGQMLGVEKPPGPYGLQGGLSARATASS